MVAQWTLIWNSSNSNKESRRNGTKTGDGLTPDDYRARDTARVCQFKVTGKKYADATTNSINRVQCFWNRHCIFMGVDSSAHLAACTAENFRVYADWRLKNFKVQKQSTIWVEWKFLRLLFKREIGRKVDEFVGEQISEYILGPLTDEYDLDLSIDYKPVVSVEDLVAILHYHWCLDTASVTHERYTVQNPLIMLMIAYTSSRPGALIESGCLRGSNDALCYKDIVLRVIPNPDQPGRHILVMEVSLLFMKGKRDKSAPTTYIFHERDDNLALCPISHFLALALADGAFEAHGINSVEDVFRIRVQASRNSLQLRWKQSMLNVPIFRRAVHTTEESGSPQIEHYHMTHSTSTFSGWAATPDSNTNLHRIASDVELQMQLMSAFIGCAARESIISAVTRFSLTRDPRVPKGLSDEQKTAIERDPQLVKLSDRQKSLGKLIKRKHGSIVKAKGTELHLQYTEIGDTIRAEKHTLYRASFERMRDEFFATIDTIEIERQLLGLSVSEISEVEDTGRNHFTFPERARLAHNLFRSSDCTVEDHHELYSRRVQTIKDWVSLCNLREGSRAQTVLRTRSESDFNQLDDIIDADTFPILCPGTQCLFCLGDSQLPHSARMYSFSRPEHLRRHVQDCHLRYHANDAPLWCPHPSCLEVLADVETFKQHAYLNHNIYL
ncbi:hypothetical protein ACJ73_04688 [Blastomyces percursus]|uniref:FluG domain-containing protein n=1 Tax=Blastomyces percursus TaxID=1658174 RepID=A0A1J9Q650_9EURO|nr:hypothetical protein ACJ73_04688 [Blastomyces percursus]